MDYNATYKRRKVMAWYSVLAKPFTAIIEGVSDYSKGRQKIKADKARRKDELEDAKHLAQVERVKRGDITERDYDQIAQENARNSLMDEIMIVWVLMIVTLLFIPATAPYAIAGFAALNSVPLWFQLIVVGGFISKLGLRFLFSGRSLFGKVVK